MTIFGWQVAFVIYIYRVHELMMIFVCIVLFSKIFCIWNHEFYTQYYRNIFASVDPCWSIHIFIPAFHNHHHVSLSAIHCMIHFIFFCLFIFIFGKFQLMWSYIFIFLFLFIKKKYFIYYLLYATSFQTEKSCLKKRFIVVDMIGVFF